MHVRSRWLLSRTLGSALGHQPFRSRPRYFQQASDEEKVFAAEPLRRRSHTRQVPRPVQTALMEFNEAASRQPSEVPLAVSSSATTPSDSETTHLARGMEASRPLLPLETFPQQGGAVGVAVALAEGAARPSTCVDDDDIVVDAPRDDVSQSSFHDNVDNQTAAILVASRQSCKRVAAPSGVSQELLDLVTDEFREQRDAERARRKRILYELTHPSPADYTYRGKLVPPPPLAFGQVTPEAIRLGETLMLGQTYQKVRSASSREYFFEINDLYLEVVMVGRANAGKSSLINALLGQSVAKTSSTPNSTREVTFYQAVSPEQLQQFTQGNPNRLVKLPGGGLQLTFVDLPGFGIEGMSDKWRENAIACTDAYMGVRRSINTVFLCIDVDRGLTKSDIKYMDWLENLHGVFWIILTKCDAVPHSRVCSVMGQIYRLMTQQRRKYRKAFPFILPVSARDGTNVDVLRGLIAETSGIIPGDKLRELLQAKAARLVDAASREEEERVRLMWAEQRWGARVGSAPSSVSLGLEEPRADRSTPLALPAGEGPEGVGRGERREWTISLDNDDGGDETSAAVVGSASRSEDGGRGRKHASPSRETRPKVASAYGGSPFKVHDGVAREVTLEWGNGARMPPPSQPQLQEQSHHPHRAGQTNQGTSVDMTTPETRGDHRSATAAKKGGTEGPAPSPDAGRVSTFLNKLEAFCNRGTSAENVNWSPARRRREEERRERKQREARLARGTTTVLVPTPDGRLSKAVAGRPCGPWLPESDAAAVSSTKTVPSSSAWKAKQFVQLATKANATAPWAALDTLKRNADHLRQDAARSKMRKLELAAYERHAGKIVEGFDRFFHETEAATYMNDPRRPATMKQQLLWEENATKKINFRAQPPGLLKAYGQQATYWPTSSVLGVPSE